MANILNVTDDSFDEEVMDEKEVPVLVDFWAAWCGPCKMIAPVLDELAEEYEGKLKVCKVNVDENNVPAKFSVMSIPTLILFKDGQDVERVVGYQTKKELSKIVDAHI
ncbi:MAG: thioredoxin [Clostridia bacterium]|nr:thioredoxin [Clostridia bacterium]